MEDLFWALNIQKSFHSLKLTVQSMFSVIFINIKEFTIGKGGGSQKTVSSGTKNAAKTFMYLSALEITSRNGSITFVDAFEGT